MRAITQQPRTDPVAKLVRRSARYVHRQAIRPALPRGLVSLSFDDCPRSAYETALPMIEARGWRATIYAAMGLCGTTNHLGLHMSEPDMISAHEKGHEIADHTFSHLNAMRVGANTMLSDIERNRAAFRRLGLPRATSFAYPYGDVTPAVKQTLAPEFRLLRGTHCVDSDNVDLGLCPSAKLYSANINDTLSQIERAAKQKRWLILFGHDVRDTPSAYGCTPHELKRVLIRMATLDLDVATVGEALGRVLP